METIANDNPVKKEVYDKSSFLHPLVYIGTYAMPDADGIFVYRLNTESGELTKIHSVKGGENPSYLAFDSHHKYLYAVNEEDAEGHVTAFEVNQENGDLTRLNSQVSAGWPCHISVDHTNQLVLTANYGAGSINAFPILEGGQLGPASDFVQHKGASGVNKERQEGPHAHFILPDVKNKFAHVIDLGLDKVIRYGLDLKNGKLTSRDHPDVSFVCQPGSGPRHLVFHPFKEFAYLIHELSSTMSVLEYDSENGLFTEIQTIPTIPLDFTSNNQCSAVHISPNGKFLYGSNRGHDTLVVYEVEEDTGKLKFVEHVSTGGKWPRDFGIDLTGNFLLAANQHTHNILVFKIDHQTGRLTPTQHEIKVPAPVCIKFIPDFKEKN